MRKLVRRAIIPTLSLPLLWGCSETPPPHCANWWYYWRDGSVVDDMARVKYLWGTNSPKGVSAPDKVQDLVGVGDPALTPETTSLSVSHKYEQSLPSVVIIAVNPGGINGPAETIAHEFKHVWVFQQWGCRINQTGVVNGHLHTDTDALPDSIELDRAPGTIGGTYHLHHDDPDTFDIQHAATWSGNPYYNLYGDNELLARVEGIANPRATYPERDWSEGGAQWGR